MVKRPARQEVEARCRDLPLRLEDERIDLGLHLRRQRARAGGRPRQAARRLLDLSGRARVELHDHAGVPVHVAREERNVSSEAPGNTADGARYM